MTSLNVFRNTIDTVSYSAGDTIFRAGDVGDAMYLIKEGHVEIRRDNTTLTTLSAGDMFGEMALISDEPRSADAIAKTDSVLLPVDEERFLYLVQHTPYFSLRVMSTLAEWLRQRS